MCAQSGGILGNYPADTHSEIIRVLKPWAIDLLEKHDLNYNINDCVYGFTFMMVHEPCGYTMVSVESLPHKEGIVGFGMREDPYEDGLDAWTKHEIEIAEPGAFNEMEEEIVRILSTWQIVRGAKMSERRAKRLRKLAEMDALHE